jgi:hypothetical protein
MSCQYCKKYKVIEDENYCNYHIDLKSLSEEEILKSHKCVRCPRVVFDDNKRCIVCISASKIKRSTPQELKCSFVDGCIFNKTENSNFCDKHAYLKNYTQEMLNNLKKCSGCKRKILIPDGFKTCEKCMNRVKENKNIIKEPIDENIKNCKSDNCKNKALENSDYCGIHHKKQIYDDLIKINKQVCSNYGRRGCVNEIIDKSFKTCESCRLKDTRNKKEVNLNENILEGHKKCSNCNKDFEIKTHFIDLKNKETLKCSLCRQKQNELDKRRDKDKRNEKARICAQKHKDLNTKDDNQSENYKN